jgi:hypothetical protein
MFEMFGMLPTDDMKSWAFRLAHFGILGGLLALVLIVALLIQNTFLIISLRALRAQLRNLEIRVSRMSTKSTASKDPE